MTEPRHHFPDDVLRSYAVGSFPEASRLAVACHLALCPVCQQEAHGHEEVFGGLGRLLGEAPGTGQGGRRRLLDALPPLEKPSPRPRAALPSDLPPLPAVLVEHMEGLPAPRWQRLIPGIRAIDLGFADVWRARLVAFRPGIPIPEHDHGGPEHTIVFQGGLDDPTMHLSRGDAATMMPGDAHDQRAAAGEPCVALIVNELAARPLTTFGRILKVVTRS